MSPKREQGAPSREIEGAVEACLRGSSELAECAIACEFHEGTLTLRGRVPTYFLKQAARSLAQKVRGVRAVENRIDVIPVPICEGPGDDPGTGAGEEPRRID